MSPSTALRTATAPPGTAPRPAPRAVPRAVPKAPPSPRLQVVALPVHARSRAGLAFACLGLLVLGLVGLLLLNVNLEHGAYVLREQQGRTEQLRERQQALRSQLQQLQAPQRLEAAARRLGMEPVPNVAVLRPDGSTTGVPSRVVPGAAPTVRKPADH